MVEDCMDRIEDCLSILQRLTWKTFSRNCSFYCRRISSTGGKMTVKYFWWNNVLLILIIVFSVSGCGKEKIRNLNAIPTFTGNYVNAVIEIPAGTNRKISYNEQQRMFLTGQGNGADRKVDFLPYPGNFGFVPSTYMDPVMGGDGEPVKILVISESLPTGAVIEVIPLLVLYFDDGEGFVGQLTNPKIIAVPANERHQVIKALNYEVLFDNYPDLVDILIKWFSSYRGQDVNELRAMGDNEVAVNEIEKWEIRRF